MDKQLREEIVETAKPLSDVSSSLENVAEDLLNVHQETRQEKLSLLSELVQANAKLVGEVRESLTLIANRPDS